MPELNRNKILKSVASTLIEERDGSQIETALLKAARMRGIPPETIAKIPDLGEVAIWSKTYTENSSSRLLGKDGEVLFETNAPLSNEEMELIEKLGLRKR